MIDIAGRIDPSLSVTFGLSVMLMVAAAYQEQQLVFAGPAATDALSRFPWLIICALAVASLIFGIFHPEVFADVGREGFASP